jgi:hypothetical protein
MSSRADLNLLFGVMAVQNDFVSRDALSPGHHALLALLANSHGGL